MPRVAAPQLWDEETSAGKPPFTKVIKLKSFQKCIRNPDSPSDLRDSF